MKRNVLVIVGPFVSILVAGLAMSWAGCVGDTAVTEDGGGNDVATADNNAPDTSPPDGGGSDVVQQPNCTATKPFGAITLMGAFGGGDAGSNGARLTNDALTVYYTVPNGVNGIIMTASRPNLIASFSSPAAVPTLSGDGGLAGLDPSVSPDGLTMYLQYNPSNFVEIRYATRVSVDAGFATPTGVSGLSGAPPNHGAPFLQGDNSTLFYVARVAPDGGPTQGGNSIDIFSGAITGQGQFSNVKAESSLNSTFDETSVAVTPDGLTAFFARKAGADGGASATYHVYTATRGSTLDAFNTPTIVPELDDVPTSNTQPTWISPDTCTIWLWSDRGGPAGALYTATKPL